MTPAADMGKIKSVFFILGDGCNLNCRYCVQGKHLKEKQKTDPQIYDLINENADMRLVFYGGEPLLYFDEIKKVVEKCQAKFSIITNGKALTDEIVDFLNAHDFGVALSWDGRASKCTRGFDVIESRKEKVLKIKNLCLTGVISAEAYPIDLLDDFQKIDDEYSGRLAVNLDELMPAGDEALSAIDLERVKREIKEITLFHIRTMGDTVKDRYIGGIIRRAKAFFDYGLKDTVYCGNGLTVLNLDRQGNLYPCHNVRDKAGTISTYRDFYAEYEKSILATDRVKDRREMCLKCSAVSVCKGGCKLINGETLKKYCDLKRAVFGTVLQTVEENGSFIMEGGIKHGDSDQRLDKDPDRACRSKRLKSRR